jgi:alpha-ketoglutarate-dependent 2,4-dichlorophenoxyacetate dioxygenase
MDIAVRPLHPVFAAEVHGVDLAQDVSPELCHAIEHAMDEYAVLVFPSQRLDDDLQIRFSERFGTLELAPPQGRSTSTKRITRPQIFDVSNVDDDGNILRADDPKAEYLKANELWHTDSSFRKLPASWSLLHARNVSAHGGDTMFADTRAAYEALPAERQRELANLNAEHSIWHSRKTLGGYEASESEIQARPPAQHALVRRNPRSGRDALYIASHASHVLEMPIAEGRALLAELMAFATLPAFVYRHHWTNDDLVIWDNRCTMHRGLPHNVNDGIRELRRTTIIDAPAHA